MPCSMLLAIAPPKTCAHYRLESQLINTSGSTEVRQLLVVAACERMVIAEGYILSYRTIVSWCPIDSQRTAHRSRISKIPILRILRSSREVHVIIYIDLPRKSYRGWVNSQQASSCVLQWRFSLEFLSRKRSTTMLHHYHTDL